MAVSSIPFNPNATTVAAGLFLVSAEGTYPGVMVDDPAKRFELAGGVLDSGETLPMWGGVGIAESISTGGFSQLGSNIKRAADFAHLTGFAVFNQNGAALTSPQSQVPLVLTGGQVNFLRLGSGARVWLPIDPALITLDGGLVTQQVSWDYTNQRIVAFATNAIPVKVLSVQTAGALNVAYSAGAASFTSTNAANALVIL